MDIAAVIETTYRKHIGLFIDIGTRTYGFDTATAMDRLQEAFIKVWAHQDKIRVTSPAGVRSYALRVYRNTCIDFLRRKKYEPAGKTGGANVDNTSPATVDSLSDQRSDPLHEILLIEEGRLQTAAIAQLPEKYREVVRLSLQGMKRKRIAQRLGIANSRIHNLKFRGLKKYEAIIQKMDPHRRTAWK
jgi:RNA polymerase sigma factor (sigma-70 family)